MKARLAALLTCALIAFGQRSQPPSETPAAVWRVVDAVVTDASGNPVTDLIPADFEVSRAGQPQKITHFTRFDTRLHTAASPDEFLPALILPPDDIRRNLVVIVDDLGLSAPGITAARNALRLLLADSMASGDRVAIFRTSGGRGTRLQLTGDRKILTDAIEEIRYLGGSTSAELAGHATWQTLGYALGGLREVPGRNVVTLMSENLGLLASRSGLLADIMKAANAAGAVIYSIHPSVTGDAAAGAALETLARDSGGLFDVEFAQVLRQERGYYAVGFFSGDSAADPSATFAPFPGIPALLKVRRPGLVVRSRTGFLPPLPAMLETHTPLEQNVILSNALVSPFEGAPIDARLTAGFSANASDNMTVDAVLHFDARSLVFIRDLRGNYRTEALLSLAPYTDNGFAPKPVWRDFQLNLRPVEYQNALTYGLRFAFQLHLPAPGGWQIRALVSDRASDRVGSAFRFVEIPDVRKGGFAISGLTMGSAGTDQGPASPLEDPSLRVFPAGRVCLFQYSVYNPLVDAEKKSRLEMRSRIFAEGRLVFDGKPSLIDFGTTPASARRQVSGKLSLDSTMSPGDYILQVTVRDTLAPPGEPRTSTQFIDFQVRK